MKRMLVAAGLAVGMALSALATGLEAAPPEPVGISLLRIEMKKALLQQDAAPKMTALRQKKLEALKADKKEDEAADAEVDLIQAQTAEAVGNVSVKELELQLQEALKESEMPPSAARPGGPAGRAASPAPDQDGDVASPTDISLMQMDLEKTKLQADAAVKIADNRQKLLASRQARQASAAQLADAEADALASATNSRLMGLEVEAAQMRLDAAMKSAAPKK